MASRSSGIHHIEPSNIGQQSGQIRSKNNEISVRWTGVLCMYVAATGSITGPTSVCWHDGPSSSERQRPAPEAAINLRHDDVSPSTCPLRVPTSFFVSEA